LQKDFLFTAVHFLCHQSIFKISQKPSSPVIWVLAITIEVSLGTSSRTVAFIYNLCS